MLMQELEMDKGIELVLKNKFGKKINSVQKLKQACQQGHVTVEFIETEVGDTEEQVKEQIEDQYSEGAFEIEDAADPANV